MSESRFPKPAGWTRPGQDILSGSYGGPESRQFGQLQAFVSSQKTLDLFEGYAQRTLPWAFEDPCLGVAQGMSLTFDANGKRIHKGVDEPSPHSEVLID